MKKAASLEAARFSKRMHTSLWGVHSIFSFDHIWLMTAETYFRFEDAQFLVNRYDLQGMKHGTVSSIIKSSFRLYRAAHRIGEKTESVYRAVSVYIQGN